jgi:hypothetical protein
VIVKGKHLTIFVENKPGEMAKVCEMMAAAGIDIRALYSAIESHAGVIRIVPHDIEAAISAADRAGLLYHVGDALLIEVDDVMGEAASITRRLAEAHVNIDCLYASAAGGRCLFVIGVADAGRAEQALGR